MELWAGVVGSSDAEYNCKYPSFGSSKNATISVKCVEKEFANPQATHRWSFLPTKRNDRRHSDRRHCTLTITNSSFVSDSDSYWDSNSVSVDASSPLSVSFAHTNWNSVPSATVLSVLHSNCRSIAATAAVAITLSVLLLPALLHTIDISVRCSSQSFLSVDITVTFSTSLRSAVSLSVTAVSSPQSPFGSVAVYPATSITALLLISRPISVSTALIATSKVTSLSATTRLSHLSITRIHIDTNTTDADVITTNPTVNVNVNDDTTNVLDSSTEAIDNSTDAIDNDISDNNSKLVNVIDATDTRDIDIFTSRWIDTHTEVPIDRIVTIHTQITAANDKFDTDAHRETIGLHFAEFHWRQRTLVSTDRPQKRFQRKISTHESYPRRYRPE
jgi:hypothetical protein